MDRPDRTTLIAFFILVLIGGSNVVAVSFSNMELPPFWGAAIRFAAAALIFWIILFVRRIEVPKGRGLVGVLIFGVMAVGINYALLYWALLEITAGFTMIVGAFVPLLTLLFALAHGQEPFRWKGIFGAVIAIIGIVIAAGGGLGTEVPVGPLIALIVAVTFLAYGPVVLKLFPPSHPVATNAVSVTTGAILLLFISLLFGEEWNLPATSDTWLSFAYLVLFGSVILFYLYLLVLSRWTASATNYAFLLFPIVTVILAAWLLGEEVTPTFIIGGAIVLLGVWVGAFGGSGNQPVPENQASPEEVAT